MKWQKFVLGLVSSKLFLIPFPLEMLKMMRQNYDCFFYFFFHDYVLVGVGKSLTVKLLFHLNCNVLMVSFVNEISVIKSKQLCSHLVGTK